jgi:ferredoxin
MAMMITDECILCDACLAECPNGAISPEEDIYIIDPALCTECMDVADMPQCADVCPVDCIVSDPNNVESKDRNINTDRKVHINW